MVDAIAWVGIYLLELSPNVDLKPAKKKSWRDKLKGYMRETSTSVTHMSA
jgi:hypothetical protein